MVHGSIPLPFRRSRSLRHRRRFPNSNLSPARPLSGTIPAAQSAKTKETESKDEKPLHRRGGAGNDLPNIGPDIRNILRSSCFGRRPRASKNHKKRRKRHRTGSETIRERNGKPRRNRFVALRQAGVYDDEQLVPTIARSGAHDTTVRQPVAAIRAESVRARFSRHSGKRTIPCSDKAAVSAPARAPARPSLPRRSRAPARRD